MLMLNLLNKLRKSDKMQCLPSILSLFCNKYNKFNNTGCSDFIDHMTLKLVCNCVFDVKVNILPIYTMLL